MYNVQIETSFLNLNPLAKNPGSAPASTTEVLPFILFHLHGPAHMGPT